MALKERLMQERNEARQEKVRLEEEIVRSSIFISITSSHFLLFSQVVTSKRHDEQEKANQLLKKFSFSSEFFFISSTNSLSRDVDLAVHKVSESEMQLRTMYRVELKRIPSTFFL